MIWGLFWHYFPSLFYHSIFRREMHWSGSKWLQDNNVKRLEKRRRSSCQCKPRQPQRKVRLFFQIDGPPNFLKDPVGTSLLKTQIIYHMRSILYINVNKILVQKRNPVLTAFCFWVNKYDSGISKIWNFFFKILKRFKNLQKIDKMD